MWNMRSGGHVFVCCGDLTKLVCNAWLLAAVLMTTCTAEEAKRTPEERASYEAGLKTTRDFLSSCDNEKDFNAFRDAKEAYFRALREYGKPGIDAAEQVVLKEWLRKPGGVSTHFWALYGAYLSGGTDGWGCARLNRMAVSDHLTPVTRADLLFELAKVCPEIANWLDESRILPLIEKYLDDTQFYMTLGGFAGRERMPDLKMRFCDFGVHFIVSVYKPATVKWSDEPGDQGDRVRNANVEAARTWIKVRLARLQARKQLLELASRYCEVDLNKGQLENLLALWASLETRPAALNIRDVKSLADLLLQDLKRTDDLKRKRTDAEVQFHQLVHERIAKCLEEAGFKPESGKRSMPRNGLEEHEWLRNTVSALGRSATDPMMRFEWQAYSEELRSQ